LFRCQPLDRGQIGRIWTGVRDGIPGYVEQEIRERRADCMQGLVPVETLRHQPAERALNRQRVGKRDLILHNDMGDRMQLCIGNDDAGALVVVLRQVDAILLVEREPSLDVGCHQRIVTFHLCTLFGSSHQ
jgi:hypothetical protein